MGAELGLRIASGAVSFEVSKGRFEAGLPGFADITSSAFQVRYNAASAASVVAGDEIVVGDRIYRFAQAMAPGEVAFSVRPVVGSFGRKRQNNGCVEGYVMRD